MSTETVVVEIVGCGMFVPTTAKDAASLGVIRAIERRGGNFAEAVRDLFSRDFPDEEELAALVVPAIILRNSEKIVAIYVGTYEAGLIAEIRENPPHPLRLRPHDLFINVCGAFHGTITRVVVNTIRNNAFCARITIQRPDGTTAAINSRSSDAIVIALLQKLPIEIARDVFDEMPPLARNDDDSYTFSIPIHFVKEPPAPAATPSVAPPA